MSLRCLSCNDFAPGWVDRATARLGLVEDLLLICHPETPCSALHCIDVSCDRTASGALVVQFTAIGNIDAIIVPKPVLEVSRHDELWLTTCFEAFVKVPNNDSYTEFNFAPSTGWASYSFSKYRAGMADTQLDPPHFDVDVLEKELIVSVTIDVSKLANLPQSDIWQIALSAVIEEQDGSKSYWALNHPPGKPDFHHPDCFALTLAPPERA